MGHSHPVDVYCGVYRVTLDTEGLSAQIQPHYYILADGIGQAARYAEERLPGIIHSIEAVEGYGMRPYRGDAVVAMGMPPLPDCRNTQPEEV